MHQFARRTCIGIQTFFYLFIMDFEEFNCRIKTSLWLNYKWVVGEANFPEILLTIEEYLLGFRYYHERLNVETGAEEGTECEGSERSIGDSWPWDYVQDDFKLLTL